MRDLTGLSAGRFHAWLQHNYLSVFDDLDDVIAASEALSLVDSMDGDWTVRSTMDDVSSSIACRSLMFSHKHVSSRTTMGFRRPELVQLCCSTLRKENNLVLPVSSMCRLKQPSLCAVVNICPQPWWQQANRVATWDVREDFLFIFLKEKLLSSAHL